MAKAKEIKVLPLDQILRGGVELHFHEQAGGFKLGYEISETKVLRSNAGYYIGHEYYEDGFPMPFDRLSTYFRSHEEAEAHLPLFKEFV